MYLRTLVELSSMMHCHLLHDCITIWFQFTVNAIFSSCPTWSLGQGDYSPGSIRPPSGAVPEDPVKSRTIGVMTGAGLVEKDVRESKYVTDTIPHQASSNNIAPTKSSSIMVRGISKNGHSQSGKKIPCRSRMPVSSADSKTNQKEECDSVEVNCGTPPVQKKK